MAEWFKALDLKSNILFISIVGSNPTSPGMFYYYIHLFKVEVEQRLAHQAHNLEVVGSNPTFYSF